MGVLHREARGKNDQQLSPRRRRRRERGPGSLRQVVERGAVVVAEGDPARCREKNRPIGRSSGRSSSRRRGRSRRSGRPPAPRPAPRSRTGPPPRTPGRGAAPPGPLDRGRRPAHLDPHRRGDRAVQDRVGREQRGAATQPDPQPHPPGRRQRMAVVREAKKPVPAADRGALGAGGAVRPPVGARGRRHPAPPRRVGDRVDLEAVDRPPLALLAREAGADP
jgi:hypothetical protein